MCYTLPMRIFTKQFEDVLANVGACLYLGALLIFAVAFVVLVIAEALSLF